MAALDGNGGLDDDDILSSDINNNDFDNDDDSEIATDNQQLNEVLDFYDCYNLLPLADRIIWLAGVKEALSYIPRDFGLTHLEIRLLVILHEEQNKKMSYDMYKSKQEQDRNRASSNVPVSRAIRQ
jgi:hypothetical protein